MSSSAEYVPIPHSSLHIPAVEQVRRQGIKPIASVDELDEFLADLYASRRASFS